MLTPEESEPASGVFTSPADALLGDAIAKTLQAEPHLRVPLFEQLVREIAAFMKEHPEERPWTYEAFDGTDGSRIFRGGTGHSLVIDPRGDLWRARSYEDFDTAYEIAGNECRIASLTPHYETMRQYTATAPGSDRSGSRTDPAS